MLVNASENNAGRGEDELTASAIEPNGVADGLVKNGRWVSLNSLRWLTVLIPFVFLLTFDLVRHTVFFELLHNIPASILTAALVGGGIAVFSKAVFDRIESMQQHVIEQNEKLTLISAAARTRATQIEGLHQAGLALSADLSLDSVLQRVVNQARELAGAQYAALGVFDDEAKLERFITSGLTAEERTLLTEPPQGLGLLGELLKTHEPLLVSNIADHPASIGFPEGHPKMTSFLGVPIVYKGRILGNLYITNKVATLEFSQDDSAVLQLFASQAAIAIENARLHNQIKRLAIEQERQRIAREMHDGLAQVLGYVNVKAGAAHRLVDLGKMAEAAQELEQLERAAREVYADVRESILGLRTVTAGQSGIREVLKAYLERFSEQSNIKVDLVMQCDETALHLSPEAEVQVIRIIQEALSNVRKHSGATNAWVRLDREPDAAILIVEDNGNGFSLRRTPLAGGPRFGLQTMKERAEALNGSFALDARPGNGTKVIVHIPIQSPKEE